MRSVALPEPDAPPEPPGTQAATAQTARPYDAFISYSHARDKPIAATLQSAMQRLGKAWYQRRALRLFRDDTSLSATPHLWPSIEAALEKARFLILMASPEAAASPWVDKELAWWLEHRGSDSILIALTAGELAWDGAEGDFRRSEAMPLPPALKGAFADEPFWIDLRAYREAASPRDARFTDLAANFAATLHGRAKEDLLSQEVRQQRRALRLAGSAVALLAVLLLLAGWQWTVARAQRNRAEHNLALATQTANGLVFNLALKFQNSGVPASVVADILTRARRLQDQLTAGGEVAPDLRRSQAAALNESASTLLTIGDTKSALAAAMQSRGIMQALLAAVPDSADYQGMLSVSDGKIGDVLRAQGDLAGALAAYRDGHAIRQALAQKDPGNTFWQRELADSDGNIGDVLKAQGNLAGALNAYREELAIVQALTRKDPSNSDWQRDLAISDHNVGDVLKAQGDLAGALAAYRDGLAIHQALAQKDPGNTFWQESLAGSDSRIGDALSAQGNLASALAAYRDALAVANALARKDPGNTKWQEELSISDNKIGDVLKAQGDLAGALASYRDGLAVTKVLAQKDPGNAEWQRDLSIGDDRVGDMLFNQKDFAGALAPYRDAFAIRQTLAQKDPSNAEGQNNLAVSTTKIGAVLFNQNDLAGALASFRDGLAIRLTLTQKDPGNAEWQRDLASSDSVVGAMLEAQGDLAGALASYRDGLAVTKALTEKDPSNALWQHDLLLSYGRVGEVTSQQGDLAAALQAFQQAETVALRLQAGNPASAGDLTAVETQLGDTLLRMARQKFAGGDVAGALAAHEQRVAAARRFNSAAPSDKGKTGLAAALGGLSWMLILNQHPQEALDRADEALSLNPSLLFVQGNRADALLLLGRFAEAQAIYLANKDKKFDDGGSFAQAIGQDFAELRKFGIDTPDMKRIENLFAS